MKKKCSKCGVEKPLEEFVKHKQCKYGRAGICKVCSNKRSAEWKKVNSEGRSAQRRKRYAETNGERVKQRELRRKRLYPLRRRAQVLRSGMRERSKKLDLAFDSEILTVSYIMKLLTTNPHCECCGKKLDIGFKSNGIPNNLSPSIDRKIPHKGYTENNISILCWRCNNLKRDATPEELQRIVDWMNSWMGA
ncbi:hypothetical protein H8E77_32980 [bacterium]|nr:hypothetical protein [bacterium]